ncbi:hypothetical protein D3C80_1782670 [compost metagenome]
MEFTLKTEHRRLFVVDVVQHYAFDTEAGTGSLRVGIGASVDCEVSQPRFYRFRRLAIGVALFLKDDVSQVSRQEVDFASKVFTLLRIVVATNQIASFTFT